MGALEVKLPSPDIEKVKDSSRSMVESLNAKIPMLRDERKTHEIFFDLNNHSLKKAHSLLPRIDSKIEESADQNIANRQELDYLKSCIELRIKELDERISKNLESLKHIDKYLLEIPKMTTQIEVEESKQSFYSAIDNLKKIQGDNASQPRERFTQRDKEIKEMQFTVDALLDIRGSANNGE